MNELRKLTSEKISIAILLALLLFNALFCLYSAERKASSGNTDLLREAASLLKDNEEAKAKYQTYVRENAEYQDALQIYLRKHQGERPVPPSFPHTYSDQLDDYDYMNLYYSSIVTAEEREDAVSALIKDCEKQIGYFQRSGYPKEYSYKKLQELQKVYKRLLPAENSRRSPCLGWDFCFSYNGIWVFAAFAGILIGARLFLCEKHTGVIYVVRSARFGRGRLALRKIAFGGLFSLFYSLMLFTVTLIVCGLRFGLSSPFLRIWQVSGLILCPYNASIMTVCLMMVLFGGLVIFLFSMLSALISQLSGGALPSVLGASLLLAGEYFLLKSSTAASVFNLLAPVRVRSFLESYKDVELFSRPFSADIVSLLFVVLIALILSVGVLLLWKYRAPVGLSLPSLPKKSRMRRRSIRLSLYEARKIFTNSALLLLAAVLLLRALYCLLTFDGKLGFEDKRKLMYMEEYGGMNVNEAYDAVAARYENYEDALSEERAKERSNAYLAGEITYEEYAEYIRARSDAESHKATLKRFLSELSYLVEKQEQTGVKLSVVFDRGQTVFYSLDFDVFLFFLLTALLAPVGAIESESRFLAVLRSTRRGRGAVFAEKLALTLVIAMTAALVFTALDLGFLFTRYDMSLLSKPLMCSTSFSATNAPVSAGVYLSAVCVARVFSALLLAVFVFAASHLAANRWQAALFGVALLVPYLIGKLGAPVPIPIDFSLLFSGDRLWRAATASSANTLACVSVNILTMLMPTTALTVLAYRKFVK